MKNNLNKNDLFYKIGNKKNDKTNDFQKFKTITSFENEIYSNDLSDSHEQGIGLKDDIAIFKESIKLI